VSVCTATCAGSTTGNGTWIHSTAAQSGSVYLGIPPSLAPPWGQKPFSQGVMLRR
jgi:hypothetical protein